MHIRDTSLYTCMETAVADEVSARFLVNALIGAQTSIFLHSLQVRLVSTGNGQELCLGFRGYNYNVQNGVRYNVQAIILTHVTELLPLLYIASSTENAISASGTLKR